MGLCRVSFTQLRSFAHLRLAQGSSHESLEMRLKWHILLKNEMLKVSLAKALEFFRKNSLCDVSLHSQSFWSLLVTELGMSLKQQGPFACFPLTLRRWRSLIGKLTFFWLSPPPYLPLLSFPPLPFGDRRIPAAIR